MSWIGPSKGCLSHDRMTPLSFSTRTLPPRDQLDAWRAWFTPVFDVEPGPASDGGFLAENRLWTLPGLAMSRVTAPSLRAVRTRALIRRHPVDHWIVTLGLHVTTGITTRNTSLLAPAGSPFVVSLGDEMISDRGADDRLQLYLSRDAFRALAPMLDGACGQVQATPLGRMLADYMILLERHLPDVTPADERRLAGAVGAMVGACIAPTPGRIAEAASQVDLTRMERVRQAVHRHLHAPALGPDILCRMVGTSRSQLYRLLAGEGGVARYIQRQRLLDGYASLSDPSNTRQIAAIAEDLCFADASSFSRAFRQAFGMSPSDLRAASAAGENLPVPGLARAQGEQRTLRDCLMGF